MKYDFDREIQRTGTNSVKWEFMPGDEPSSQLVPTDRFSGEDRTLPMWVADMDFPCPKPVVDALIARAEHGIYGYTAKSASYFASVVNWMKKRHGWDIQPEWICTTPGVVPALNMLVQTFIAPCECVLVQTPVYYPFFTAITNNHGELVANPLVNNHGRYSMDFSDLHEKVQDQQVRMVILSNPHNPVGRVWTREELITFGEACLNNNVLIVSDEIHGDLVYQGNTFLPFASISEAFAQNSITCTAPSKTFNMAGLQASNIIIPNNELRVRFERTLHNNGLLGLNAFGIVAVEAAYNYGEEWLEQVMEYIGENLRYLENYIAEEIPEISVIHPEGTYLVWLDCQRLGLGKMALKQLMLDEASVYLDDGFLFGPEGAGFQRINIACPRLILIDALQRIKDAIDRRRQHSE